VKIFREFRVVNRHHGSARLFRVAETDVAARPFPPDPTAFGPVVNGWAKTVFRPRLD